MILIAVVTKPAGERRDFLPAYPPAGRPLYCLIVRGLTAPVDTGEGVSGLVCLEYGQHSAGQGGIAPAPRSAEEGI